MMHEQAQQQIAALLSETVAAHGVYEEGELNGSTIRTAGLVRCLSGRAWPGATLWELRWRLSNSANCSNNMTRTISTSSCAKAGRPIMHVDLSRNLGSNTKRFYCGAIGRPRRPIAPQ